MKNLRCKGFTLVELLIVIVVIGVLAAMMMFSSTEAVSSARAAEVINNMNMMKKAALEFYTDNIWAIREKVDQVYPKLKEGDIKGTVVKYMQNGNANLANELVNKNYQYWCINNGLRNNAKWYVQYEIKDENIKKRLLGRAKSTGLLNYPKNGDVPDEVYTGTGNEPNKVYMRIR